MLVGYFKNIFSILSDSFSFFIKTFKKQTLLIWGIILVQLFFAIPIDLYLRGLLGSGIKITVIFSILTILYVFLFIFMLRKVFDMASCALDKDKLSWYKFFCALFTLCVFNIFPKIVSFLLYKISVIFPDLLLCMKYTYIAFSIVYTLCLSLSIASIVLWQDENPFLAVFKSVQVFFKKILKTLPLFLIIYLLAFLLSQLFYLIIVLLVPLNSNLFYYALSNSIYYLVSIYPLYVLSGIYISLQANILKE